MLKTMRGNLILAPFARSLAAIGRKPDAQDVGALA
jgi:hypothetical protein